MMGVRNKCGDSGGRMEVNLACLNFLNEADSFHVVVVELIASRSC